MISPQLKLRSVEPSKLNDAVRSYWESSPCGVSRKVVSDVPERSREWFERIERARYERERFIPALAQFSTAQGEKLLQIGGGAGRAHLQCAWAGGDCDDVDV